MIVDQKPKSIVSLAFYLPQFHAIPENDLWWGPGFTEWTQVRAWKPFYEGHRLRKPVSPLGEYNLLNPDIFDAQIELATNHGIDGFAVWDYWFGEGERLLDRPLELLLKHRTNFRFCLAWANHSWKNWEKGIFLKEQKYLGAGDYEAYFHHCARHFATPNYIKLDNKPVFVIHDPSSVPDLSVFVDRWNTLARQYGFSGIYFIGERVTRNAPAGELLDACADSASFWTLAKTLPWNFVKTQLRTKLNLVVGGPQRYDYWRMVGDSMPEKVSGKYVPTVFTGWDTTPRHGRRGVVFDNFNESHFDQHLETVASLIKQRKEDRTIVLIKSWNEWAEGNVLEPDNIFGTALLKKYRNFKSQFRRSSTLENAPLSVRAPRF